MRNDTGMGSPFGSKHEDILTKDELAARLKKKPSWPYEQTRSRKAVRGNDDPLPYRKIGGELRFYWPEVVAWLDRQDGVKPPDGVKP